MEFVYHHGLRRGESEGFATDRLIKDIDWLAELTSKARERMGEEVSSMSGDRVENMYTVGDRIEIVHPEDHVLGQLELKQSHPERRTHQRLQRCIEVTVRANLPAPGISFARRWCVGRGPTQYR